MLVADHFSLCIIFAENVNTISLSGLPTGRKLESNVMKVIKKSVYKW